MHRRETGVTLATSSPRFPGTTKVPCNGFQGLTTTAAGCVTW
jgi:hypothetical protein